LSEIMGFVSEKLKEWPPERRYKSVIGARDYQLATLFKIIYERWGDEAVYEVVHQLFSNMRDKFFEHGMKTYNIVERDIKAYLAYYSLWWHILGLKGVEVIKLSEGKYAARFRSCPFFTCGGGPVECPTIKICEAMLAAHEQRTAKMFGLKCTVNKLLPKGDNCCEIIVEQSE